MSGSTEGGSNSWSTKFNAAAKRVKDEHERQGRGTVGELLQKYPLQYFDAGSEVIKQFEAFIESTQHQMSETDSAFKTVHGKGSENHPAHMPRYQDVDQLRLKGLKATLSDHQKQGLQWCLEAESRQVSTDIGEMKGLWKTVDSNSWTNILTQEICGPNKPTLPRGGIIADAKGLGKSMQLIALCLLEPQAQELGYLGRRATLVVVYTKENALEWMKKIKDHCQSNITAFNYTSEVAHRVNLVSAQELQNYHFVVTTHQVLRAERKRAVMQDSMSGLSIRFSPVPLFVAQWARTIIDEGENIRNKDTELFQAVCKLQSDRRWALVTTCFVNEYEDTGSLLMWLGVSPFAEDSKQWTELIDKVEMGNQHFIMMQKSIYHDYILKRLESTLTLDGTALLSLPPLIEKVVLVDLTSEDRKLYDELNDRFLRSKELYLRLRQICCDRRLVEGLFDTTSAEKSSKSAKMVKFMKIVKERLEQFPNEKIAVFSSFAEVLQLIDIELEANDICSTFYKGDMSRQDKARSLERFKKEYRPGMNRSAPQVMLMTNKTGSDEVDLTEATCVILFEPWWAPLTEAKAIRRAHRLGQTKTVQVYRLITKDTIEIRESFLQLKKKWKGAQGFDEKDSNLDCDLNELMKQHAQMLSDEGESSRSNSNKRKIKDEW